MIPSIRSMIAAILLAVVALGGGFGVFAEFRVNHEPARLAAATLPLRLAADDATLPAWADGRRPIVRVALSGQRSASRGRDAGVSLAGTPIGADAAGRPVPLLIRRPASTRWHNLPLQHSRLSQPERQSISHRRLRPQLKWRRQKRSQPGRPTISRGLLEAATEAPPPETVATGMSNDQPPSAQTETEAAPPEIAVTGAPDDQAQPTQTATTAAPPETAAPTAAAPAAAVEQQDTARKVAARKRLAAVRRVRRTRATAVAQSAGPNNASPQPGFQSAPQAIGGPFVSPPNAKRGQN